jgi:hypothetical protein
MPWGIHNVSMGIYQKPVFMPEKVVKTGVCWRRFKGDGKFIIIRFADYPYPHSNELGKPIPSRTFIQPGK